MGIEPSANDYEISDRGVSKFSSLSQIRRKTGNNHNFYKTFPSKRLKPRREIKTIISFLKENREIKSDCTLT